MGEYCWVLDEDAGVLCACKSFFQKTLEGAGGRNWANSGRLRGRFGRGGMGGLGGEETVGWGARIDAVRRWAWGVGCCWVPLRQAQGRLLRQAQGRLLRQAQGRLCGDAGMTGWGRRGGRPPDGATGPAPGCRGWGIGVAWSWGLWYSI